MLKEKGQSGEGTCKSSFENGNFVKSQNDNEILECDASPDLKGRKEITLSEYRDETLSNPSLEEDQSKAIYNSRRNGNNYIDMTPTY